MNLSLQMINLNATLLFWACFTIILNSINIQFIYASICYLSSITLMEEKPSCIILDTSRYLSSDVQSSNITWNNSNSSAGFELTAVRGKYWSHRHKPLGYGRPDSLVRLRQLTQNFQYNASTWHLKWINFNYVIKISTTRDSTEAMI
jgi:hypothetical protein